jgi:hypothetical protein
MRTLKKIIAIIVALSLSCMITFSSSAHVVLNGILQGNNANGWVVDRFGHLNHSSPPAFPSFTYRISTPNHPQMTNRVENAIASGANAWRSVVDIRAVTSGGTGTVRFTDPWPSDYPSDAVAGVQASSSPGTHYSTFTMHLNPNLAASINSTNMAHEFGHVIGLNDLGIDFDNNNNHMQMWEFNRTNIMYYNNSATATSPTFFDRSGASVVMGRHTTHYWHTTHWVFKSNVNGKVRNMHRSVCDECNGSRSGHVAAACTYNGNGMRCTVCNFSRNGDVNQDGVRNNNDVVMILDIIAGNLRPTWRQYYFADIDGDGRITMNDVQQLQFFLNNMSSILE